MNIKTECYALEMTTATFDALKVLIETVFCLISFKDEWTYITAREKDFAFIEDVLAKFV